MECFTADFYDFFQKRQKLAFGWPAGYLPSNRDRLQKDRRVAHRVTTNDNEWQRMTMSDKKWQRVTRNDKEWENEWQRETKNDMSDSEWQGVIKRMNINKSS